jgi:hypothetical protein
MRFKTPLLICLFLAALPLLAQESASFKVKEYVFNEGGNPAGGTILASASYRMTLDAIGESIVLTSTFEGLNFRQETGFVSAYPPPRETINLRFTGKSTLTWDPEISVGDYCLYRGLIADLQSFDYGTCLESDIAGRLANDPANPPSGACYFYLVTARNRIDEEGIKGYDSVSQIRPNTNPCP